jgi:hypothetical protein
LTLQEREEISLGMSRDISMRELARQLGRDPDKPGLLVLAASPGVEAYDFTFG